MLSAWGRAASSPQRTANQRLHNFPKVLSLSLSGFQSEPVSHPRALSTHSTVGVALTNGQWSPEYLDDDAVVWPVEVMLRVTFII